MEGESNNAWAAELDARNVASALKRQLFSAADQVWKQAKAAVDYETRNERRPDVIQAATVWGALAYTIAVGAHELDPKDETGLYPGEAFCDTSAIP